MSKKNLLNESQVRQFMKLAKLEPLTPGFVEGLAEGGAKYRRDDEDLDEVRTGVDPTPNLQRARRGHGRGRGPADGLEEASEEAELHATEDELGAEDHFADEEGDELDALEDEGAPEDEGGDKMISVADLLSALEVALEEVTGEEVETELDADLADDEVEADVELAAADDAVDMDVEVDDDMLEEDKAYTSKKEKPGADMRKGASKRGAEGTKLKHDEPGGRGHKKGDDAYVNEEQGADDREDEHLGAKDGKESGKKQSMKDRRKEMRGARRAAGESGDPVPTQEGVAATDELVEQITKRVAARILKSALAKK